MGRDRLQTASMKKVGLERGFNYYVQLSLDSTLHESASF
jgi:hypothetical protein